MKHPSDIIAIDDLCIYTGYDVQPVVCADSELATAIERYSRTSTSIEQAAPEEEVDIEETSLKWRLLCLLFTWPTLFSARQFVLGQ